MHDTSKHKTVSTEKNKNCGGCHVSARKSLETMCMVIIAMGDQQQFLRVFGLSGNEPWQQREYVICCKDQTQSGRCCGLVWQPWHTVALEFQWTCCDSYSLSLSPSLSFSPGYSRIIRGHFDYQMRQPGAVSQNNDRLLIKDFSYRNTQTHTLMHGVHSSDRFHWYVMMPKYSCICLRVGEKHTGTKVCVPHVCELNSRLPGANVLPSRPRNTAKCIPDADSLLWLCVSERQSVTNFCWRPFESELKGRHITHNCSFFSEALI